MGGFAESSEVIDGDIKDYEAFNYCLAEDYYYAMKAEDFDSLGYMDRNLLDTICYWLNYDGEIGKDILDDIKKIPKGFIYTNKKRTLAEAVIENHKAGLAFTFFKNGNQDVRLYLTCMLYSAEYEEHIKYLPLYFETVQETLKFFQELLQYIDVIYKHLEDDPNMRYHFLQKVRKGISFIKYNCRDNPENINIKQEFKKILDNLGVGCELERIRDK